MMPFTSEKKIRNSHSNFLINFTESSSPILENWLKVFLFLPIFSYLKVFHFIEISFPFLPSILFFFFLLFRWIISRSNANKFLIMENIQIESIDATIHEMKNAIVNFPSKKKKKKKRGKMENELKNVLWYAKIIASILCSLINRRKKEHKIWFPVLSLRAFFRIDVRGMKQKRKKKRRKKPFKCHSVI